MAKRNAIIIGNWKMNLTIKEALRLLTELKGLISGKQEVEVVIAPDFVSLHPVCVAMQDDKINIAAQNMFWEDAGAFTGEVSASMLNEVGCEYVILGHSERRTHFHESDRDIKRKVIAAFEHDLVPIICVGETEEQRQRNETMLVIEKQLKAIFHGADPVHGDDLIIAYEPVWAIGTGKNATPEQAQEVHQAIRKTLSILFRVEMAEMVRIIYGGSVTPENIQALMKKPDIDGVLVGGASLDARSFAKIVSYYDDESSEEGD